MLSVSFVTQQVRQNNVHRLICNHYTIRQSDNLIVLLIGAENLHPNAQLHRGGVGGRLLHNLLFCSAKYGINQSYWRYNIRLCRPSYASRQVKSVIKVSHISNIIFDTSNSNLSFFEAFAD